MKLIIQIPCYNEEKTLPIALKDLPKQIVGIDIIEYLIIDDGSFDKTVEVAKANGVHHIINLKNHKGLASAFIMGIDSCLKFGADIIVNTDADNQYNAKDIPNLVKPILEGKADIVIGERPISVISHFSFMKKILQKIGSWVVRLASSTRIPDAPSGFRAISRDAAMKLNVFSPYTYTLETIIQAGQKNMVIVSVPINVNENLRPSRLVKNIITYIKISISTIVRIFVVYRPFRFFLMFSILFGILGSIPAIRFLVLYLNNQGTGKVQSLILSAILLIISVLFMIMAFIGDLLSVNRRLMEDIQYRLRKNEKYVNKL